jgi:hypothetical protein
MANQTPGTPTNPNQFRRGTAASRLKQALVQQLKVILYKIETIAKGQPSYDNDVFTPMPMSQAPRRRDQRVSRVLDPLLQWELPRVVDTALIRGTSPAQQRQTDQQQQPDRSAEGHGAERDGGADAGVTFNSGGGGNDINIQGVTMDGVSVSGQSRTAEGGTTGVAGPEAPTVGSQSADATIIEMGENVGSLQVTVSGGNGQLDFEGNGDIRLHTEQGAEWNVSGADAGRVQHHEMPGTSIGRSSEQSGPEIGGLSLQPPAPSGPDL